MTLGPKGIKVRTYAVSSIAITIGACRMWILLVVAEFGTVTFGT